MNSTTIGIVFLIMMIVVTGTTGAEEIYISNKGPSATVTKINGQGTANASLTAKVSVVGATEYCNRDPGGVTIEYGGSLTIEQCIAQTLSEEKGTIYIAAADCKKGLLRDSLERTLKYSGQVENIGIVWTDLKTGKKIGNCGGACNDGVSTLQFQLLCPFFGQ